MFVKRWMTEDPIVVGPDVSVRAVSRLFHAKRIRRLPVVEAERLIGIVTLTDMHKLIFPDPDTVELVDPTHLTVRDMMTPEPMTTCSDDPLEKVAIMMARNKVSSLPVVDNGQLVGIITETDIFRALLDILGVHSDGTRLLVALTDTDGFRDVLSLLDDNNVELLSLMRHEAMEGKPPLAAMRVKGGQLTDFIQALKDSENEIVEVE